MKMLKLITAGLILVASPSAFAGGLRFTSALDGNFALGTDPIKTLAEDALVVYEENDRTKYLGNLFRLQQVAGRYQESASTIRLLRALSVPSSPDAPPLHFQYELYAEAKALQRTGGDSFSDAYRKTFRRLYGNLDDRTAHRVLFPLGAHVPGLRDNLDKALAQQKGGATISLPDALELVKKYQVYEAYSDFVPLIDELVAEDDAVRYEIDENAFVMTPAGVEISAIIVRPRAPGALPTLFQFTIYANDAWAFADAKRGAAHGYASVVAYSRGKGWSPDAIVPFEHDGVDAAAVIDWIAQQPWSDGRVGMYGGSYSGFTQWAAAKQRPKALKAMATSATAAPGIDVPMEGNVFLNFMYPWPFYTTNDKGVDDETYGDQARWNKLNRTWYQSGKPYSGLPSIDQTPNPVFERWLQHPSYDVYWKQMIPQGSEYSNIDFPVLATTGYFDGAQVGVLHYLSEHLRHLPDANHTLLIGPYEHLTMQAGVSRDVGGYTVDPVAHLDLQELRLQWFDHVFRGLEKPHVLKDRINYQVMGANVWKHAGSIEAMSSRVLRMYLEPNHEGTHSHLEPELESKPWSLHIVDFADRSDVDRAPSELVIASALDARGGMVFTSNRFEDSQELSGRFSGMLEFTPNKRDFDFTVTLYELMPDGKYFQLAHFMRRASHASDRTRRQLLSPGKAQHLLFESERIASRRLQPGSRVVVVLGINKQPDLQINYGSGGDVSEEDLADAGEPLQVRWHASSFIDLPMAELRP